MAILASLDRVGVEWPAKRVLDGISLGVYEGERIGVVGPNGEGKSTLLGVLAGNVAPTDGRVVLRHGTRVGLLGQTDALDDDGSVREALFGDAPDYEWAASARIREILDSLLGDVGLDRRVGELSGGERRRVDLARLLCGEWDLLLLDEPTNHLDVIGIDWLAQHLASRWPAGEGALVCVTHDRWFLDAVCDGMWELHDGSIDAFEGGFSAYMQQRLERDRQAERARIKRANILRRELAWLARAPQARATRQKFRKREAEALISDVPELRDAVTLRRAAVARLGKQVFELEGVAKSYGARVILSDVDWIIGAGDRIGIIGANGAGKTTLLDIICGVEEPSRGIVKRGKSVRLARVSQHLDLLAGREGDTVDRLLSDFKSHLVMGGEEVTSRSVLESLGFAGNDFLTRIGELSGGQRRRLAIACALMEEPNVLVLDEPGNDLDVDMLAALESVLDGWPGTLLLVTHDRYLMERVTDDVYAVLEGSLRHLPGGIDEFLRLSRRSPEGSHPARDDGAANVQPPVETSNPPEALNSQGEPSLSNAERRDAKRRFDAIERKVSKRRAALADARAALESADPTDYQRLLDLQAAVDAAAGELASLEDAWLDLALLLDEDVG